MKAAEKEEKRRKDCPYIADHVFFTLAKSDKSDTGRPICPSRPSPTAT